jgi:hypothetical protein
MGKLTKGVLFLIALFAGALGAWIIALPILAFIFVPLLLKGRKGNSPTRGRSGFWLNAAGVVLLLLGLVAIYSGGAYSPLLFLAGGAFLLLRQRLRIGIMTQVKPVKNSILLRSWTNPFRWVGIAEAKVATRDIEGALSGVRERIVMVSAPTPRIFLIFLTNSWGQDGAERDIAVRIRSVARALVPLGVYLLPVDSTEAAAATRTRSVQSRLPKDDIVNVVSTLDYGAAAFEARHGFVSSIELYQRADGSMSEISLLSGRKDSPWGQITARELLHTVLQKIGAPRPDGYVAFLAGMAATQGETLGQRVVQSEREGGNLLLVASSDAPQVKLTKAQLRAIAEIYE